MQTNKEIIRAFDKLSADLRANLVSGDEFRARRKQLYERVHQEIKAVRVGCSGDCPFCADERLSLAEQAGQKMNGIRI